MADIEVERDGLVGLVWFNRPDRLNAFRTETFRQLHEALDHCSSDDSVQALVLSGRGRAFCAGEDLDEMHGKAISGFTIREAHRQLWELQTLTLKVDQYPKPVIAAVNGPAVGLGAELVLACDARLASRDAYFLYPEARRAMVQTNGAFHYLPRIVGLGRATEWLVTGRKIGAPEALSAGLVTAVVDEGLARTAAGMARQLVGLTRA